MVVFESGSCEIIDAFAANTLPKDATVSSIELSSGGTTALAVYSWEPEAVSVSCRRLYASCQKSWKLAHVWSASGSWRHSLYSDREMPDRRIKTSAACMRVPCEI